MEPTQGRTLSSVFRNEENIRGGQSRNVPTTLPYNTFLTVFSINLCHRYPDVTELDWIRHEDIERIAKFSAACSTVALETWNRVVEERFERKAA